MNTVLLRTLLSDVGLFDGVVSDRVSDLMDVFMFDVVSGLVTVSVVAVLVFRTLRRLCCSCVCC